MSAAIEALDGKFCMAYTGETPWHGLGQKVLPDLTPLQMLKQANLDWKVNRFPLFANCGNGIEAKVENKEALVRDRDNKVLSIISNDWNPVQNHEAFEFFNDFVMKGQMEMHTAGSLREGQMVFALAKIKESFDVFGGDQVDSYLLFSNPHEYGRTIDVRFTPIRVVCNNTLTLALSRKNDDGVVRVDHRKPFDAFAVKALLEIATMKLDDYKKAALFLGSKKYNNDTLTEYFQTIFPLTSNKKKKEISRNARVALEIVEQQPGAEFAKGTWWNGYNAVSFMTDHVIGHDYDKRFFNSQFGNTRVKKVQALKKALEFAKAA